MLYFYCFFFFVIFDDILLDEKVIFLNYFEILLETILLSHGKSFLKQIKRLLKMINLNDVTGECRKQHNPNRPQFLITYTEKILEALGQEKQIHYLI